MFLRTLRSANNQLRFLQTNLFFLNSRNFCSHVDNENKFKQVIDRINGKGIKLSELTPIIAHFCNEYEEKFVESIVIEMKKNEIPFTKGIYQELIQFYSKTANTEQMHKYFVMMKEDNIEPTPKIFEVLMEG